MTRQFLILLISFSTLGVAQPQFNPPSGVYCSCPPTTGNGSGSVVPSVASTPYVNGILVRCAWKHLEPSNGTYNWKLLDDQIAAAESYGKKVSLAVGGGPNSPDWLYGLGVDSLTFSMPFAGTVPVPWDSIFLAEWTQLIIDLGNRYSNDTTIQLVYITHASANGFEMQLPFNPNPSYSSIGYSDQRVIDSWKQSVDAFNSAFPNHYLTNDFHPVNGSDFVADSVYSYAIHSIGSRYGASAWWWTQNNTNVYPAQYSILLNSSSTRGFTGVQMAASGFTDSARFGSGGMPAALALAVSQQVCYWEVWNSDILSGVFDSILSSTVCSNDIGEDEWINRHRLGLYPNPFRDVVKYDWTDFDVVRIDVYQSNGVKVLSQSNLEGSSIDLSLFPSGVYVFILHGSDGSLIPFQMIKME